MENIKPALASRTQPFGQQRFLPLKSVYATSISLAIAAVLFQWTSEPSVAQAQDSRWTNISGGAFHDAGNWDAGVPDADMEAIFAVDSFYDVELESDATIRLFRQDDGEILWFGGKTLTTTKGANLNGGILTLTGNGTNMVHLGDFLIAQTNDATLNIDTNTSVTNARGTLGGVAGMTGTANVDGAGALWTNQGTLFIGERGTGLLNITNGGEVTSTGGVIGLEFGESGTVNVNGIGSAWTINNSAGLLVVGQEGNSRLNVLSGGSVSNFGTTSIGVASGTVAVVLVDGSGSTLNQSELFVGNGGSGISGLINISNGGLVSSDVAVVAAVQSGSGLVRVLGEGSRLQIGGRLEIGSAGNGTALVSSGGTMTSDFLTAGTNSSGTANITVSSGGVLETASTLTLGWQGDSTLQINSGGAVNSGRISILAREAGSTSSVFIQDTNSRWNSGRVTIGQNGDAAINVTDGGGLNASSDIIIGQLTGSSGTLHASGEGAFFRSGNQFIGRNGSGTMIIENGATGGTRLGFSLATGNSFIGGSGSVEVRDAGSRWSNGSISIGENNENGGGQLHVANGGSVGGAGFVGRFGSGSATVTGAGSFWTTGGGFFNNELVVGWGSGGSGNVLVSDGGRITSSRGLIGSEEGSLGSVTVTGTDSIWDIFQLDIGPKGQGNLEISSGGQVLSQRSTLGKMAQGSAEVLVTGTNSIWEIESALVIGAAGSSTLEINDNGLVRVGANGVEGLTTIAQQGSVILNGGRFEFGNTDAVSLNQISGSSGSLAGGVQLSGYNHIETLNVPTIQNLDVSDVLVSNEGVLFGDGASTLAIQNKSNGEIRTLAGQWARIGSTGSTNAGEINNFGGLLEFENDLTNLAGGFIGGRGQFLAHGGITNEGVMAFTAGTTDVLGDVENLGAGQIVTSGSTVLTFFDDVIHNGAEIRTANGSETVFLGDYTGAGSFTGTGDVFFEGDLRPGNSPDVVDFEGNVFLGSASDLLIELAGLEFGEFDRFDIEGDLHLDGALTVGLIDGFLLENNQEFLFASIGGELFGSFDGLGEGDLVGDFGGRSLYISYARGDGNDISLFSAVPEPSGMLVLSFACMVMTMRRRRRKMFCVV